MDGERLRLTTLTRRLFCLSQYGQTAFQFAENRGRREVVAIFNEFASVRAFPCCPSPPSVACAAYPPSRQPHQLHLGPASCASFQDHLSFHVSHLFVHVQDPTAAKMKWAAEEVRS